jgi:hypothetical protein
MLVSSAFARHALGPRRETIARATGGTDEIQMQGRFGENVACPWRSQALNVSDQTQLSIACGTFHGPFRADFVAKSAADAKKIARTWPYVRVAI